MENATTFQFVPESSKPVEREYDLDAKALANELQQLKTDYDSVSGGGALVKGAGGQWVLPSEEIGFEALDVAEWDASKERHKEFDELFETRQAVTNRQEMLAFPVVQMRDGVGVGPAKAVGDVKIGDISRTQPAATPLAPAPAVASAAAPSSAPAKPSATKNQLPGGLQLLSRQGKREVNLDNTAPSTGFFTCVDAAHSCCFKVQFST